MKRKPGAEGKRSTHHYVETESEEFSSFSSGEVTTKNNFSVPADQATATEEGRPQERSGHRNDCSGNATEESRILFSLDDYFDCLDKLDDINDRLKI